MSGERLFATGSGKVQCLLMIEGWPHLFATSATITATDWLDGRTVIPGLSYEGIVIEDSIIPSAGKIRANGITFRIKPPYGTSNATTIQDPVTASLSVYPQPFASLGESIESETTEITLVGAADYGVELTAGTVYHLGTEAIRCTSVTSHVATVVRHIWETLPQSHHTSRANAARSVYVYEKPPTMEGRHAYLFIYDEADVANGNLTGIQEPRWRGIVARPPRLHSDNVSWSIECLAITHVLRQQIAGGTSEVRPVGIHHHNQACFAFRLQYDDDFSDLYQHVGLDDERSLVTAVNALLEVARLELGLDTYIDYIRLEFNGVYWQIIYFRNATAGDITLGFHGGSFICGFGSVTSHWYPQLIIRHSGSSWGLPLNNGPPAVNTSYTLALTWDEKFLAAPGGNDFVYAGPPTCPVGYADHVFSAFVPNMPPSMFELLQPASDEQNKFAVWRVWIDQELEAAVLAVDIDGLYGFGNRWNVVGQGTEEIVFGGITQNVAYIDLEPRFQQPFGTNVLVGNGTKGSWSRTSTAVGFWGVLGKDSVLKVARPGTEGSVADFVNYLVEQGVDANDGDMPWLTDADFAIWQLGDTAFTADVLSRHYEISTPVDVETVLAEELRFAAHFMRIGFDGRMECVPMLLVTDTASVEDDHVLDGGALTTPGGRYGAWITAEPQRDGIINSASVQQVYDSATNTWLDEPRIYQDANAIATHKLRGAQKVEIKPYSRPAGNNIVTDSTAGAVGTFILFHSQDYIVLTVKVPFSRFGVLCGDRVRIAHRTIPDGAGARGVSGRLCVCIGRKWKCDGKEQDVAGELTLWMPAQPPYGYAPSALIDSKTNTSGNVWVLTFDPVNDLNQNLSTNGDGKVWEHFELNDLIRIVQYGVRSPVIVVGTVTTAPTVAFGIGSLTVTLTSTWVPADPEVGPPYLLEFKDVASSATAHMRKFAEVAEPNLRLPYPVSEFARRLA